MGLTKLEEEIKAKLDSAEMIKDGRLVRDMHGVLAKAAAEVASRYIDKAVLDLAGLVVTYNELEKWKKENGVTGEVNS